MKQRQLEPELLDSLPHDDPGAIRSRAALRLINHVMGNYRWIEAEVIRRHAKSIIEIGAGCGTLAKRLRHRLPRIHYTGIDLAPRPADLPSPYQWLQQDLLTSPYPPADMVIANLFLHHFDSQQLHVIGERLRASCRHLIVNEPARRSLHLYQGKLLNLLGIHPITRHDMAISIRAGFLEQELVCDLGLKRPAWTIHQHCSWLGAYRLIASKTPES